MHTPIMVGPAFKVQKFTRPFIRQCWETVRERLAQGSYTVTAWDEARIRTLHVAVQQL